MIRGPEFPPITEHTGTSIDDRRTRQLLEVLVFLFLIVPSMVLSFFALQQGNVSFDLIAFATILRDLALVSLIAFLLWRNREPVIRIGWTLREAPREIALGAILFLPLTTVAAGIERWLQNAGLVTVPKSLPAYLTPARPLDFAVGFLLVAVVAVAEETIFRGYLMLRFTALTQSPIAAALLSTVLFSVGHGYEGTGGVITVGVLGLGFALVYLWRGSLVAPIVMHFLQDFMAIIVLPLLVHHP